MTHLYIVPDWFFGFDIAMEILFGIITLAVAISAYRIYKISRDRSTKNFGTGFLLISLSYLAWAALNFFALTKIDDGLREFALERFALFGAIGLFAHIILLAVGLITLVYATLRIRSLKVYYLLLGLELLVIASSYDRVITVRIISVFLLSYLAYHFFVEWRTHRNSNIFYSFAAFALLLLSNLDFAFSTNYYQAYVLGHILELGAYILILKNLISTAWVKKSS